jgi:hypothetical protein
MARSVSVPLLPGNTIPPPMKADFRRPQRFVYQNLCATEKTREPLVELDRMTRDAMRDPNVRSLGMTRPMSATLPKLPTGPSARRPRSAVDGPAEPKGIGYRPAIEPAWLKHDRQCLRFYGFFQENVVESRTENSRYRYVVLTYFLEDGTLQITEQKVENSGIWPQGPMLSRHRVPKGDYFWTPTDLRMGIDVTIYARTYRLINADSFTKWFYEEAGMDIGTEEEAPLDNFQNTQIWKKEMLPQNQGQPRDVVESKEFNELKLGAGRSNNKIKQFLENDRKVLRFYAYWDDPTRYGARWYFTVHYYLADDTVEINNMYERNVGKWLVPVFMKRGPLELFPQTVVAPGMIKAPSPILLPKDIEVGKTIPVYGRQLFIYDADAATYAFYKGYMGIEMQKVEIPEPKYQHVKLLPPPKAPWGAEQDTLNGVNQVTERKPPHRDMVKLMMHGNKALRFEAVPEDSVPENTKRKFLIEMFLADHTLLVGERKVRNSGFVDGGKFKERDLPGGERRTNNPDTGRPFEPEEFYVGALVKICCMPMRIIRADEWSLKHMETDPETFPQSAIHLIVPRLTKLLDFQDRLPAQMSVPEFEEAVAEQAGVQLTEQEVITVLRNCADPGTADVRLDALCELIRHPPKPPARTLRPGDPMPTPALAA